MICSGEENDDDGWRIGAEDERKKTKIVWPLHKHEHEGGMKTMVMTVMMIVGEVEEKAGDGEALELPLACDLWPAFLLPIVNCIIFGHDDDGDDEDGDETKSW